LGQVLQQYGNDAAALSQFIEAVRLEPKSADAHYHLALVLARRGRIEEAIDHDEQAIFLRPDWPEALNNQAWILATTSDARYRDPRRALELAERAKLLADLKMPRILDTLAAAQAAAGNYDQAQQTAAEAIEWAKSTDQIPLAEQIEARLKLYRDEEPIREEGDAKLPGS
jgi:Flp pilus assembly protein TadD